MYIFNNTVLSDTINKYRLKIYDCGYADAGSDWHSNAVTPPFSRLYFILGGDGWYDFGNGRGPFEEMHSYLLPAMHSFRCGCKSSMRQFYFHLALLEDNGVDMMPFVPELLSEPFSEDRRELLNRILRREHPSITDSVKIHSLVLDTLHRILEANQIALPEKKYSPCVSSALSYIHQNVSARLTLEAVTAASDVSQSTLSKRFRQELGITVGRYIENVVFAEAQRLLCNSELSIAEISERLGFCDQFYFSSRFKHHYLESPQNYRRNMVI